MSSQLELASPFFVSPAPLSRFSALHWPADSLGANRAWHGASYWINERAKNQRYSFRMLRYWFIDCLLATERQRLGRPLAVLEVGVDRGQMKAFVDGVPGDRALYSSWDAADVNPQIEALSAAGYGACHRLDLDDTDSLARFVGSRRAQYDAVILLHVLEHLTRPERAMTFLSGALAAGGIVIGGFPVLPSGIARLRERQLRNSAQPFGHVSAFSPRRVRKMAERAGLDTEYAAGAFAWRASGSRFEDRQWWLRLNVAFGALLPGWPGEIYWQLRKPATTGSSAHGLAVHHGIAAAAD